jgi:hypothetical protein
VLEQPQILLATVNPYQPAREMIERKEQTNSRRIKWPQ